MAAATRAGGAQPGGGSKALFGSTLRKGAGAGAGGGAAAGAGSGAGAGAGAGGGGAAATGAGAVLPGATLADVKVARVSAEATAGVAPPGGAQRDGDAEAAAGAPSDGGSDVRDGAGGSGAGAAGASAGGGTGVDVTGAGGGAAVTGGVGVAGGVAVGAAPGAALGVVLVESALPSSAAAGRPGRPLGAGFAGGDFFSFSLSLAFASRSAASRFSRASRSLASRSAASLSAASFWAFWPPLAATIEPTRGVRVSSVAANPGSYWRPGLADGSAPVPATLRSAPGRVFWLLKSLPPPNQPQPDSRTRADTPSRLRQRRKLPILSCSRRIVLPAVLFEEV